MTIPLIERARFFADRICIVDCNGSHRYRELLHASERIAAKLLAGRSDLDGSRIAFLVLPTLGYPAVQWGVWRAGGVAVPLAAPHPRPELEHIIDDCQPEVLIAADPYLDRLRPIAEDRGLRLLSTTEILGREAAPLPDVASDRPAMIVYTSGTTGGAKGVVTTHDNIAAQVESLVEAWAWSADDRVLLVLPLHHVHGIVNVLACALWSGAVCEMPLRFEAADVWDRFAESPLTLFMAVPTIYSKLISAWEEASSERQRELTAACTRFRLMVSGSAALPVATLERWRAISGHVLLERYGMTEIGMALSNPLKGERRPGFVGQPLPGVEVRRVGEGGGEPHDAEPGEIWVRGPGVFREYWRRPTETAEAFAGDWFKTGDVAIVDSSAYRLLGRTSIDIIKTGGYKVSALEIEETLREHPAIADCAVIGTADEIWGERVAAVAVLEPGTALTLGELRAWTKDRLAAYKAPTLLRILEELPRNSLGKVVKTAVRDLLGALPGKTE